MNAMFQDKLNGLKTAGAAGTTGSTTRSAAPQTRTNERRGGGEERTPAEFWMNLGFFVENPETGEREFVSIKGVAIDRSDLKPVTRNSSRYEKLRYAYLSNLLDRLEAGLASGETCEPSDLGMVGTLDTQFRRRGETIAEGDEAANVEVLSRFFGVSSDSTESTEKSTEEKAA